MKRLLILLVLAPVLMATQCEDDFDNSGFQTSFLILNETGSSLFLLSSNERFQEIENQTEFLIGSDLNSETDPILPSETFTFSSPIRLFISENNDFVQVYEQDPINDGLWVLSEPLENNFEYRLIITNDLLN